MKNNIKFIGRLIVAFSLMFSACGESFLDVDPSNSVLAEKAIRSEKDVEVAINGLYNDMQDRHWMSSTYLAIPGVMADGIGINVKNSNRYTASYGYYVQKGYADPLGAWKLPYRLIRKANLILEKVDNIKGDKVELNHYKGVVLGLRAFAHFDLVRMFAHPYSQGGDALGIPIVTGVLPSTADVARNTVGEVYTQVIKDLNDATKLLNPKKIERGKFHYWGAKALLARVYLYHEDWDLAAKIATEVLENNNLASREQYMQIFNGNNPESIFELINTAVDNGRGDNIGKLVNPKPKGYGDVFITEHLQALFKPSDIRHSLIAKSDSIYYPNKYPTGGVSDNVQIIRASEVSLIAAEAYAKGTNPRKDELSLEYLNKVITRSVNKDAALSNLTGQALVDSILVERERELFCEGHRLFDLTRNNKEIRRGDDYWSAKEYKFIKPNNPKTILPIPLSEMNVNSKMKQNPGY